MSRKITRIIGAVCVAALTAIAVSACEPKKQTADEKNAQARKSLMERATNQVPVPDVNHFLTRQYLAEWMNRMDDPSKVFYIYVFSPMGISMGYFVGTRPISLCTFMTPTVKEWLLEGDASGRRGVLGPAPALDGVYYGEGGSCDTYFFFDAESDAMVHFTKMPHFLADAPIELEADPLKVKSME